MPLATALREWDRSYKFFASERSPVDESQIAASLDSLTDDEILDMADQFLDFACAYVAHRHAVSRPGVAKAPFNFGQFLANAKKVYNFVAPILTIFTKVPLPTIPADTAPVPASDQ